MIKKVGEKDRSTGKTFYYSHIKADPGGWVDANKYLPADYDLMFLKVKDKPTLTGWSVGRKWDGLRLEDEDEVLYWKKKPDQTT